MNERIRELVRQAHNEDDMGIVMFSEEKFAELIVQECIGVVEGGRFLHDEAPTARFAKECSDAIKRHFGIKE
jgi:hypothetical protein